MTMPLSYDAMKIPGDNANNSKDNYMRSILATILILSNYTKILSKPAPLTETMVSFATKPDNIFAKYAYKKDINDLMLMVNNMVACL